MDFESYHLERFESAQDESYERALEEIKSGQKQSCWMWYIFPQLRGLGFSQRSKYYGIENLDEARQYLENPLLGSRLKEISEVLLTLESCDPHEVMGDPDDRKLQSSMTLFEKADGTENSVFSKVLEKYFGGQRDQATLDLLG